MSITRIVVATDLSPAAEVAVDQGLALARKHGAELVLVHACEIPEPAVGVPPSMSLHAEVYEKILQARLDTAREGLERVRTRIDGQGVQVSHVLREGFADAVIVDSARDLHADLVVVGSLGRTGVARVLLGSVAERVVRLSEVPVLVARAAGDRAAGGFHEILVAVDFTEVSARVLEAALGVAAPRARVDVLHCVEHALPALEGMVPARLTAELQQSIRDGARTSAAERGAALIDPHRSAEVTLTFQAVEGPPAATIAEVAARMPASLIVTGSHGRRGLRRWILGSVAEVTVRHAPCSVLVVH